MKNILLLSITLLSIFELMAYELVFSKKIEKDLSKAFENYIRISPDDKANHELSTKTWIQYDENRIYILWEIEIDENFRFGEFAIDDEIPQSDYVRFQLITQLTEFYAYVYYAFPRGNRVDAIRKSNLGMDFNWDSTYTYKNVFIDGKWICKMEIPFKDLRFTGECPYDWKMILTRYDKSKNSYYSNPYSKVTMQKDYFRKANPIRLNETINKSIHLKTRISAKTGYDIKNNEIIFDSNQVGLDLDFIPSNSFKTKLTIQPDFSETPVDEVQDIYNDKYEPSFSENRYFFTEDLDVFGVGQDLLYTRYLVKPSYAFKVTGNTEYLTFGALTAKDKEKILSYSDTLGNLYQISSKSYFNVAAFKLKGKKHRTQFTFINRMNELLDNKVIYVAPSFDFKNNYLAYSNFAYSRLKEKQFKNEESFKHNIDQGYVAIIGLQTHSPITSLNIKYKYCSDNYKVKTGRQYENGYHKYHLNIWKDSYTRNSILSNYNYSAWTYYSTYSNYDFRNASFGFNPWIELSNNYGIWLDYNYYKTEEFGSTLVQNEYASGINLNLFTEINFKLSYHYGKIINYHLLDSYWKKSFNSQINGNLFSRISYWFDYKYIFWVDLPESNSYDDKYSLFNANVNFTFSRNIKISCGVRNVDYTYEEDLGNNETLDYSGDQNIFSNFIWEYKPGSNIYLGYNYANSDINNKTIEMIHTFYVKATYRISK